MTENVCKRSVVAGKRGCADLGESGLAQHRFDAEAREPPEVIRFLMQLADEWNRHKDAAAWPQDPAKFGGATVGIRDVFEHLGAEDEVKARVRYREIVKVGDDVGAASPLVDTAGPVLRAVSAV